MMPAPKPAEVACEEFLKELPADDAERVAADVGLIARETRWHGDDDAETLRRWRARFHDVSGDIDALGYDARFRRLWDDYLAYCESRS